MWDDKSKFGAILYGGKCMYYSYVMGIGDEIYSLEEKGFAIERFGDDYGVSFSKEMAGVWEDFITRFLEIEYWNEYLTEKGVVFLFHLQEGIRRYEVENFLNDEVLALCEKLCECEFSSIKEMLKENEFYKDKIV
jgi:hypothetical protein